jgi:hypothetical protein
VRPPRSQDVRSSLFRQQSMEADECMRVAFVCRHWQQWVNFPCAASASRTVDQPPQADASVTPPVRRKSAKSCPRRRIFAIRMGHPLATLSGIALASGQKRSRRRSSSCNRGFRVALSLDPAQTGHHHWSNGLLAQLAWGRPTLRDQTWTDDGARHVRLLRSLGPDAGDDWPPPCRGASF